jgi:hypothetical protein
VTGIAVRDCGCGWASCTGDGICPCEDVHGPRRISNPSGLPAISYRVGDFASFRHELVRHLPGEQQLAIWRPTANGDLALQIVDWFAIVADILTFYSERIANEAYLGTALLPESVQRLVSLLGYRPRPGIGAVATLGVIASGPGPIAIPDRFAIASKARPGIDSQTFELTTGTTFAVPTSVPSAPPDDLDTVPTEGGPPAGSPPGAGEAPPHDQLIVRGGVLVKGKVSNVKPGDRLLLIAQSWTSASDPAAVVSVTGLVNETDPHGKTNTRVLLTGTGGISADAKAADYALKRSTRTSHLVTLPSGAVSIKSGTIVLDSTARFLKAGDPLLVEVPGAGTGLHHGTGFSIVRLTKYQEELWYANGTVSNPTTAPSNNPIPLMVALLTVAEPSGGGLGSFQSQVTAVAVESGWTDVGKLLDTPVSQLSVLPSKLTLGRAPAAAAGVAAPAIVQDANGNGALVTATPTDGSSDVTVTAADGSDGPALTPPLQILWDLITVTRGSSVRGEHLGTGDATLTGQDFQLSRSPVTYLADGTSGTGVRSRSGDGYSSTIELIVDGIRWTEVPMLFGRSPDALVFSTYEDTTGKTHVVTGDGINGARLKTGAAVTANYRIQSGATVPPASTLSQILRPVPNLAQVRNPAPPIGGADPDPPAGIRQYAPRSVLTFGRAVSGDDYAAVAALAPGVTRASAMWAWDAGEQRSLVHVYVGDDGGAVTAARTALSEQADPNRPLVVLPARRRWASLELTVLVDPAWVPDDVVAAVRSSLLDAPGGLFAPGVLQIGETLFRSRLEEACQLPGVLAVHHITLDYRLGGSPGPRHGPRWPTGEGGFFAVRNEDVTIDVEQA